MGGGGQIKWGDKLNGGGGGKLNGGKPIKWGGDKLNGGGGAVSGGKRVSYYKVSKHGV